MLRRSLAMPMIQKTHPTSKNQKSLFRENIPNISLKETHLQEGVKPSCKSQECQVWPMLHLFHPLPPTTLLVSRGLGLEVKELTNKTRPGAFSG